MELPLQNTRGITFAKHQGDYLCKTPGELPLQNTRGITFAKHQMEEVLGGFPGKGIYRRLRFFLDI